MTPIIVTLSLVYGLFIIFFFIAFLVIWLKRRQQLQSYFPYGILAGATITGLQLMSVLLDANSLSLLGSSISILIILSVLVNFLRMIIFTAVGMEYAAELHYPSFPILSQIRSGMGKVRDSVTRRSRFLLHTLIVTVSSILYSLVLFKLTNPEIGESVKLLLGGETVSQAEVFSPASLLVLVFGAFNEEIVFRLGIQNFLAKHLNWRNSRYWLAITATSILWTLGHTGSLSPDWVKFAQVFPVGLLLGWLFRKHGIESCILAHSILNVVLSLLFFQLIEVG